MKADERYKEELKKKREGEVKTDTEGNGVVDKKNEENVEQTKTDTPIPELEEQKG